MKEEKKQFWIGTFIAAGIALALIFLLCLGAGDFFSKKIAVVTFFEESVQGLEVGSPVKFKGVSIGKVSEIHILIKPECVLVKMEIEPDVFVQSGEGGGYSISRVHDGLCRANETGYGCRLEFSGLTGMKYIEINEYGVEKRSKIPRPAGLPPEIIYLASVPSIYSDATDAIEVSLARLAKVDFDAIGANLNESLCEIKDLLRDPAWRNTLERLDRISANAEKASSALAATLTEEEIRNIVRGLDSAIASINRLSDTLNQEMNALDLPGVGKQFSSTAQSVQRLAESLRRTEEDFTWTLQKVNQFLDLSSELVEYVGKDPNSILKGKRTPEILPNLQK